MDTYTVDYLTGIQYRFEKGTLEKAKKLAADYAGYTREDIVIKNSNNEVVAIAKWFDVLPEQDDQVLFTFGSGFYQVWDDELAEMAV